MVKNRKSYVQLLGAVLLVSFTAIVSGCGQGATSNTKRTNNSVSSVHSNTQANTTSAPASTGENTNDISQLPSTDTLSQNDQNFIYELQQNLFPVIDEDAARLSQTNSDIAQIQNDSQLSDQEKRNGLADTILGTMNVIDLPAQLLTEQDGHGNTLSNWLGSPDPNLNNPQIKSLATKLRSTLLDLNKNCQQVGAILDSSRKNDEYNTLSDNENSTISLSLNNIQNDLSQIQQYEASIS